MDPITITLTGEEALVLLDWLIDENNEEQLKVDPAVRQAMWNLEALLEAKVPSIVAADFGDQLEQARTRLHPPPPFPLE